jgi:hypothetical protein
MALMQGKPLRLPWHSKTACHRCRPVRRSLRPGSCLPGARVLKDAIWHLVQRRCGSMGTSGATEQAVIVAGTGAFRNARGVVYAYGDYIGPGKWGGRYVAEICVPR